MPNNFIYKNIIQNDNERIIQIVRQAKQILISRLIIPVILIGLTFFLLFPFMYFGKQGIAILIVLFVLGLFLLVKIITIWYFKTLVITNQRIIDIDQRGIFSRTVSDITMEKIQDVFYQVKGIRQTLTGAGDVQIILADNKTKIEFKNASAPQKIQQLILQYKLNGLEENIKNTKLSAEELINLVKKIKAGLGEKDFGKITETDGKS